jgi:hypothetical protein
MRLEFQDVGTERDFWSNLSGYTVEIDGVDYVLDGSVDFDLESGAVTVTAKHWDDEKSGGVGDDVAVPVGPMSTVSIY